MKPDFLAEAVCGGGPGLGGKPLQKTQLFVQLQALSSIR